MPTYEYACRSCGEHLEVVQSFKDDALTTCPGCKGALRKVFGAIGIAFKGSGFYKTDSRAAANSDRKSKSAGDKADKSEKTEKADKKADAASGSGDSSSAAPAATPSKTDSAKGAPAKTTPPKAAASS